MSELNEEHQAVLDVVSEIAREQIKPLAAEIDERERFPQETFDLLGQQGVLAPILPEAYGGIDLPFSVFFRIIEEIAKVCASSALILIAQADGLLPILRFGTDEQKRKYLPGLATSNIAAIAATEPGAGSDLLAMRTTAKADDADYVLNGQKCFITNGSIADTLVVYAYTDREKGSHGISAFIVEKGTPGLNYGKNEKKMGMRGSINSELIFDNLRIPKTNMLGKPDDGFANLMATLNCSRMFAAAQAVGLARGAIDEVVAYSRQRVQFGKPISQTQAIQFMLADMVAKTEAAGLLTEKAACALDHGNQSELIKSCALAKVLASDTAMQVTTDAVQIMGGYGYMRDFPLERMMRDAKLIQIYTGTNQILRMVAAREIIRD